MAYFEKRKYIDDLIFFLPFTIDFMGYVSERSTVSLT